MGSLELVTSNSEGERARRLQLNSMLSRAVFASCTARSLTYAALLPDFVLSRSFVGYGRC